MTMKRDVRSGTTVAARERTLPRLSAKYVFSGGKGLAAYNLTQKIEASARRGRNEGPAD